MIGTLLCLLVLLHGKVIDGLVKTLPVKVVVTGAHTPVGYAVFKNLLRRKNIRPVGLVPCKEGLSKLHSLKIDNDQAKICDIRDKKTLKGVFDNAKRVVICSGSIPKQTFSYKLSSFLKQLFSQPVPPPGIKDLYYEKGKTPYDMDFLGQMNLIDACKHAGVSHVVLFSRMGAYRGSYLNQIGRPEKTHGHGSKGNVSSWIWKELPAMYRRCEVKNIIEHSGKGDMKEGNAVLWKHLSEIYLIRKCIPFTILHTSQITNEPGGIHPVIWDTDDYLYTDAECQKTISAEDAAEVAVQTFYHNFALNRAIDITSDIDILPSSPQEAADGSGRMIEPIDWDMFWSIPGNCLYAQSRVGCPVDIMEQRTDEAAEDDLFYPVPPDDLLRLKTLNDQPDVADIEDS